MSIRAQYLLNALLYFYVQSNPVSLANLTDVYFIVLQGAKCKAKNARRIQNVRLGSAEGTKRYFTRADTCT